MHVRIFTEEERTFLEKEIVLLYRNGVLGLRSLYSGMWNLFRHALFKTDTKQLDRAQVYVGLYEHAASSVRILYRSGEISFHTWVQSLVAWMKFQIRRNQIARNPSGSPYPIFYEEFLQYYTSQFAGRAQVDVQTQRSFLRLCGIRLQSKFFFPSFVEAKRSDAWKKQFLQLLAKVELAQILQCDMDLFHKHYFLTMKLREQTYTFRREQEMFAVYAQGCLLLREKAIRCVIQTMKISGDHMQISAVVKAAALQYTGKPYLYAVINSKQKVLLELSESSMSYYKSYEKTASFYFFRFRFRLSDVQMLSFDGEIGGIPCPVQCEFMETAPFYGNRDSYVKNQYCISFAENAFQMKKISEKEQQQSQKTLLQSFSPQDDAYQIRNAVYALEQKRIWLYSDYVSVQSDNALYQFLHDFDKTDGIARYYVSGREDVWENPLLQAKHKEYILPFGSQQHQIYFLAAEKILASFVDAPKSLDPFEPGEFTQYADLYHAEIIYLQHGILHAHIPWKYSPVSEQFHADQIVISSYFEAENLVQTYHFSESQLIWTGMPRYDVMPRYRVAGNKILFAPSWRAFVQDISHTVFWEKTMEFLNMPRLHAFLEEWDMILELKLHPMLEKSKELFQISNPRVRLKTDAVKSEEYQIFLTDFSSYVFDFAYLSIPVIYFLPDEVDFKAGKYQYRQLDLPFEKGFGNFFAEPELVVDEMIRIAKNNFIPDVAFHERMCRFFLPLNDCCEQLYINVSR